MRRQSGFTLGGFTLVELLVVIAILGVLMALLLPAVQAAREAARRMQCLNNLKNLGLAVINYELSDGHLPPGRYGCDGSNCTPNAWSRGASGFLVLLPHLEQQALFDSIDFDDGPWKTPANAPERNTLTPLAGPTERKWPDLLDRVALRGS